AKQCLSGSRSEANYYSRFYRSDFSFEPGTAGGDVHRSRPLVNASLASRFPVEVFDYVCDVDLCAVDAAVDHLFFKELAGGADKRPAGEVFIVARLLADKDRPRVGLSFPKNGLSPELPKLAGLALRSSIAQRVEIPFAVDQLTGRSFRHRCPVSGAHSNIER